MSTAAGLIAADAPAARAVYDRARRDLGDDLDGGSLVDLLADNFPWPLDYCRAMAAHLMEAPSPRITSVNRSSKPSAYQDALTIIQRHPFTGGADCLAKLLLSLWNDDAAFSFRECIRSLDAENTLIALRCVTHFAARGEDDELVKVGYRVLELYPRLWELGQAATTAKAALRREWETDDRRRALETDD